MNRLLARRFTLGALLTAALLSLPTASRACQYCRQGEDPEAYRFMNEGRIGGGFPVDAGLGQYAGDPGAGAAAGNVVSHPAAPDAAAGSPAASGAVPPTPPAAAVSQTPVVVPAAPTGVPATAAIITPAGGQASSGTARWADLGLLGLLGLGGWFGWRTRQTSAQRRALA